MNSIDTILIQEKDDANVSHFDIYNSDAPAIYVACLAAYNDGRLHGRWIDATQGEDGIMDHINAMLLKSPANEPHYPCEEWAIHDYQNFERIKIEEYHAIADICTIVEMLEEYGLAFSVAYQHSCDLEEAIDVMENKYIGEYESPDDFIENYVEETCMLEGVSDFVKRYIDYRAILRDMECGGEIFSDETSSGKIHYFYT